MEPEKIDCPEPHLQTVKSVMELVTSKLKLILKQDFDNMMNQNAALHFEIWWDEQVHKATQTSESKLEEQVPSQLTCATSEESEEGEPKLPAHWRRVTSAVAEPGCYYYFNTRNKKSVWTVREALLPKNNICKRKPVSQIPRPPRESHNEDSSENGERHQNGQKQTDETHYEQIPPSFDFGQSSQNFAPIPPVVWPTQFFPYNPNVPPPNYPFPHAWFPQNYPSFVDTHENIVAFHSFSMTSTWQSVIESESSFHETSTQSEFGQNQNERSHAASNLVSERNDGLRIDLREDDLRLKLMAKRQRCVDNGNVKTHRLVT